MTPERIDYARALAADLEAKGEVYSAETVRQLVEVVELAKATCERWDERGLIGWNTHAAELGKKFRSING